GGKRVSAESLALEKGLLTRAQVETIQKELQRRVYYCPCGEKMNIFKKAMGKRVQCPGCGEIFAVPSFAEMYPTERENPATVLGSPPPPASSESAAAPAGYVIMEKLGEGGMGIVFRALQQKLDRIVAVKLIRSGLRDDPEYAKRFRREMHVAAQMQHPHIATVYDAFENAENLGFAMEWIEGPTLRALIAEQERLSVEESVTVLKQLGSALVEMAEKKIVHRDIKPENIMRSGRGRFVLMDLGLAKNTEEAGFSTFTADNVYLGTPYYIAPEQIDDARRANSLSDIYSLGATVYHALSGTPPFTGTDIFAIFNKVLTRPPAPLSDLRKDAPAPLCRIIEKMLEKEPAERFPHPEAFLSALAKEGIDS
ncbi:MAG: serine/threonine-protein kinase, partial [Planctomycetota bacterium]